MYKRLYNFINKNNIFIASNMVSEAINHVSKQFKIYVDT